ncbi:MAG: hypothetical protein LBD46_08120, partial [Endomicrobium sp.]|nr:hypothetical protein [Endomicrobium sp.]
FFALRHRLIILSLMPVVSDISLKISPFDFNYQLILKSFTFTVKLIFLCIFNKIYRLINFGLDILF